MTALQIIIVENLSLGDSEQENFLPGNKEKLK